MSIVQLDQECEGIQPDGPPKKLYIFNMECGEFVIPTPCDLKDLDGNEYDHTVTFKIPNGPHPDAPKCPDCGYPMSAAGGVVHASPPLTSWACWPCDVRTDDITAEEVKPKQLNG